MLVYRGSSNGNFEINPNQNSRYGFPALFFATEIKLAKMYAVYEAQKIGLTTGGFVYSYSLPDSFTLESFSTNNQFISYCEYFRKMILKHKDNNCSLLKITDIFDYPSQSTISYNTSDIICCFDFSLIKNQRLILKNVTSYNN